MIENHPRWQRQVELEQQIVQLGIERYRKGVERARERGEESTTDYGQALLRQQIGPFAEAIKAFIEHAYSGKGGRYAQSAKYLKPLSPEENAFIATKTILDQVSVANTLQRVAVLVGSAIEDELQMRYLQDANAPLFDAIMSRPKIKRQGSTAYVRRLVHRTMTKAKKNPVTPWKGWPEVDRLHLGLKLIELFMDVTGIIEKVQRERTKKRSKPTYYLRFTPAANEWIEKRQAMSEVLTPAHLFTVVPPQPWETVDGGGYHTRDLQRRVKLVKTRNMNYLEELRHTEMPLVYEAVNTIQSTAWRINRRLYETLAEVWDSNLDLGKLPPRDDVEVPAKPWDIEENVEARRAWAQRAEKVHDYNARLASRRFQVGKALWVAGMALEEPAIYFPHQLDFRGRIYPVTMFLNPQAADYAKALVTFAEGKPIEDDVAAGWLAVHGANLYGHDKVGLQERAQWVLDHEQEILASAEAPTANTFWSDADKPWQFLAFCFEWQEFRAIGYGYESRLPVALDGTCNGLQHFSAMLRDEIGGKAVNLTPADKPQDIYQRVADVAIRRLETEADPLAQQWLAFGINRKTTKRAVMVLPYGGTRHACVKYTKLHVEERIEQGERTVFADNLDPACEYLATIVWSSIGNVVVKAREAMKWLHKIAKVTAKAQLPVTWTTPAGFPVVQAYPELRLRKIKTLFHGEVLQLRVQEETDKLDPKKQATAISPNFVHSIDAAALMLTTARLRERGVRSFAMVHDSYGTVAADVQTMSEVLREEFVRMYQEHDVLSELRDSVVKALGSDEGIPPVPDSGSLEIEAVLESPFFFA